MKCGVCVVHSRSQAIGSAFSRLALWCQHPRWLGKLFIDHLQSAPLIPMVDRSTQTRLPSFLSRSGPRLIVPWLRIQVLGWAPSITLKDGLERTGPWILAQVRTAMNPNVCDAAWHCVAVYPRAMVVIFQPGSACQNVCCVCFPVTPAKQVFFGGLPWQNGAAC